MQGKRIEYCKVRVEVLNLFLGEELCIQLVKPVSIYPGSTYYLCLIYLNDPLMTVMSLIDGKILKYLQDNGDRSHSMS